MLTENDMLDQIEDDNTSKNYGNKCEERRIDKPELNIIEPDNAIPLCTPKSVRSSCK